MKLAYIFMVMLILFLQPLHSQGTLRIEISDLESDQGNIFLELKNENNLVIKSIIRKIEDHKCEILIKNLVPGNYAFRFFHDENDNNLMDTNWLGIPEEGYGFSNYSKGSFLPPAFEKTLFSVKGDTSLKCTPEYIKF